MKKVLNLALLMVVQSILILSISAQTTEFSYQGFVTDNNAPANGSYDMEFRAFDTPSGGVPVATNTRLAVTVTNGVFVVTLDFGDFPSTGRHLEIAVRPAGVGSFVTLSPRSKILSVPTAILAKNSISATNALALGGTLASQFVQTNDLRLSDDRNPLPGSSNYVQNRTTAQTATNFNIQGNGTVGGTLTGNIVSASTQFNLGANRVLAKVGQNNLFLGTLAGSTGGGIQNTLLGDSAGRDNAGNENVFAGFVAGQLNTTGINNSFFGSRAGQQNLTGSDNTMIGYNTDAGTTNLTNATAIGSRAFVEASNSIVLGSVNGKNGATSDVAVGIGTTTPGGLLDIEGQLPNTLPPFSNLRVTNFGRYAMLSGRNSRGTRANPTATQTNDQLFLITADGHNGSAFSNEGGQATIFFAATENWTSTANGTRIQFNTTANGTTGEVTRMTINHNGDVGIGIVTPTRRLDVDGNIRIGGASATTGCVEDRDGTVIAGVCSSDLRFKKNVTPFPSLLENFSRLRPVNYFWRADEFADQHFGTKQSFGLIAQDVEALFPELVVTDEKGFKAVNYSKLPMYTIQAVKELKIENDVLKQRLEQQQVQIDELKRLIMSIKEAK